MEMDTKNLLNSILENLSHVDFMKSAEIPNIDLYMDQVTSFMEKQLKSTKRNEEDKVLTKTMINNYAKNNLLPAPIKKKYSKEHLLLLIFIYYFKNILTMKDIEVLLNPLTEKYFQADGEISIANIYDEICEFEKERTESIQKEMESTYSRAMEVFPEVNEEDRESLQLFFFICSLSFDVYVKKLLIEKLIDELPTPVSENVEKEKDKEKEKEKEKENKKKK